MAGFLSGGTTKSNKHLSLRYPARYPLFKIVKIGRMNGKSCSSVLVGAAAEPEKSTRDYRQVAWQNSCLAKDAQGLHN
jgi:hypothetical protein